MREFCLVSNYNPFYKTGEVVTMSQRYDNKEPGLTEYQRERGLVWVPAALMAQSSLTNYRYWNERP